MEHLKGGCCIFDFFFFFSTIMSRNIGTIVSMGCVVQFLSIDSYASNDLLLVKIGIPNTKVKNQISTCSCSFFFFLLVYFGRHDWNVVAVSFLWKNDSYC